MKKVLLFGILAGWLGACKKEDKPLPEPTGKPYVSKMTMKSGEQVETYDFTYNANNKITHINTRLFTIDVEYNEQKQVQRVEKKFKNALWNIVANYTYTGNQISREHRRELTAPPDPEFSYSYDYELGANTLPARVSFINPQNTVTYSATMNYGANNNPASIVTSSTLRTEYEYSDKDFALFPNNSFIYHWVDIMLTSPEHGYYVPFTKQPTKIKRTNGNRWDIHLNYTYNTDGTVSKLVWQKVNPAPHPSSTIEYVFEYKKQ
jgi:hypothetical protein